jgi:hypothetical protein
MLLYFEDMGQKFCEKFHPKDDTSTTRIRSMLVIDKSA